MDTTFGGSASCVVPLSGAMETHALAGNIKWMGSSKIPLLLFHKWCYIPCKLINSEGVVPSCFQIEINDRCKTLLSGVDRRE